MTSVAYVEFGFTVWRRDSVVTSDNSRPMTDSVTVEYGSRLYETKVDAVDNSGVTVHNSVTEPWDDVNARHTGVRDAEEFIHTKGSLGAIRKHSGRSYNTAEGVVGTIHNARDNIDGNRTTRGVFRDLQGVASADCVTHKGVERERERMREREREREVHV
jgi:hypothetical protein